MTDVADKTSGETSGTGATTTTRRAGRPARPRVAGGSATVRTRAAQLLWLLCVVAALFLAVGALLVALEFNEDNGLVSFVLSGADALDLGVFGREDGVKEFVGADSDTKNALVNWGLGAVAWLVLGRVLDRVVRP